MTISVDQRTIRNCHTKAMLPVLGGLSLLGLFWTPAITTQVALLLIGVATIGLAHGAMDHRVGEILMRRRFGRLWPVPFTISYLTLGALALAGWVVTPAAALIVFLLYSAFHFGSDRSKANGILQTVARGATPLLLPISFQPEKVSILFSTITSTNFSVDEYVLASGIMASIAVLVTITSAIQRSEPVEGYETVLLVVLNLTSPPLVAFTVYFVLLHSVRHIIELAAWLEPKSLSKGFGRIARESLPLTILLLASGVLGIAFLRVGNIEPTIVQAVFVGLSCLTVPHMAVTYLGERHFSVSPFNPSPSEIQPTQDNVTHPLDSAGRRAFANRPYDHGTR